PEIIKVFGEAFSKKLQKTSPFWKKATPKNFSNFYQWFIFKRNIIIFCSIYILKTLKNITH
ncbi:hypothetical protein, partial [Novacetimonas hansenii]|uniref:hypothetical protein n=1 Tax=Novacetimonas hansenii TaxID=436 RepID=UPI0039E776CC